MRLSKGVVPGPLCEKYPLFDMSSLCPTAALSSWESSRNASQPMSSRAWLTSWKTCAALAGLVEPCGGGFEVTGGALGVGLAELGGLAGPVVAGGAEVVV